MRRTIGGALLGVVLWAVTPASLMAHGGHGGGHEGPFGVFHPILEPGSVSATVALIAVIAGVGVVWARLRSKA